LPGLFGRQICQLKKLVEIGSRLVALVIPLDLRLVRVVGDFRHSVPRVLRFGCRVRGGLQRRGPFPHQWLERLISHAALGFVRFGVLFLRRCEGGPLGFQFLFLGLRLRLDRGQLPALGEVPVKLPGNEQPAHGQQDDLN
jgi:hypothetical protein